MGVRKRISAEKRKESRRTMYFARLRHIPVSARKVRLVADMIRGIEVFKALGILRFSNKKISLFLEKLLKLAISNWEQKTGRQAENGELFITMVNVDVSTMLKRIRPAPQGRAHRVRKRFSHVVIFVNTKNEIQN
ncbi:MAG: 50S ribosomal protein L22 [Candidatus Azobacteroides pseudotrichonymphae]|jgi:large subunit ribosomal protein L22|nr:50S ribosomal protein L22 [Bacteroidales bacterium OttesenSCG-928-I14]GMO36893.1 MAG: 50S ribosomal protein L22 [Candidatus Azobacteroides pseudotrichonymphae]